MVGGLIASTGAILVLPPGIPPLPEVSALPVATWWPTGLQATLGLAVLWTIAPGIDVTTTRVRRIALAAVAAIAPLICLLTGWGVHQDSLGPTAWALVSLVAAATQVGLASLRGRALGTSETPEVGLHAISALSLIGLAAVLRLDDGSLTIALAVIALCAALIQTRIRVPGLAAAVTAVAIAAVTHGVLELDLADQKGVWLNHTWWDLGIPIVLLAATRRVIHPFSMRNPQGDVVMGLCLVLVFTLAAVQVHLLTPDAPMGIAGPSRLAFGGYALIALVGCWGWLLAGPRALGFEVMVRVTAIVGLGMYCVGPLAVANPFSRIEAVSGWPIFNDLLIVYGLSAALIFGVGRLAVRLIGFPKSAYSDVVAAVMAVTWATIELRFWFNPEGILALPQFATGPLMLMQSPPIGQLENTAFTALWLALGLVAVGAGAYWRHGMIRRLGLGLILLSLAKVVLFDLVELSGLWRSLSFIAVGAVMIAAGWLEHWLTQRLRLEAGGADAGHGGLANWSYQLCQDRL